MRQEPEYLPETAAQSCKDAAEMPGLVNALAIAVLRKALENAQDFFNPTDLAFIEIGEVLTATEQIGTAASTVAERKIAIMDQYLRHSA